jgi:hypothetical protein
LTATHFGSIITFLTQTGASMQKVVFNTDGSGYWSNKAKSVEIVDVRLGYVSDEKDFGELCVYFNDTWDNDADGLIYTDRLFLLQLQMFLEEQGLSANVDYSEQGMQGDDYVSLDVEDDFIASWVAKFGEQSIAHLVD